MSNIIYDANFNGPEAVPFIGEAEKYHYVYLIVNTLNQKIYIGVHSTKKLNDGYMSSSVPLKNDIKLFGENNFKKYNLFYYNTRVDALNKESSIVSKEFCMREDTYNMAIGGGGVKAIGSFTGKHHSEHSKKLMSEKAKQRPPFSAETKEKISKAGKGRKFTEEHKRKISEANKGKKQPEEAIRKTAEKLRGRKRPEYLKLRQSEKLKGRKHTEEHNKHVSEALKGRKFSKEHREKLSKALKGRQSTNGRIIQKFDLEGNLIQEFNSINSAAKDAGFKQSQSLSVRYIDEKRICKGFIYKYKNDGIDIKELLKFLNTGKRKTIIKRDKEGNIIKEFYSILSVAHETNINYHYLYRKFNENKIVVDSNGFIYQCKE